MNLLPDEEQTQLLDAAVAFLRQEAPVEGGQTAERARGRMGRGFWTEIAELGWIGLGLDEAHGGVGYSLAEEVLFFREFGRHLVSPTILGAVLGARLAAIAGKADLAGAILAGKAVVAVSVGVSGAKVGPTVDGRYQVFDAEDADYALFCDAGGAALIPVAALVDARKGECLDERLTLSTVSLAAVAAVAFVPASQEDLFQRGAVLSAAMLAGMAEASRDISVEYAKTRQQFGQAIGGFQAIKHYCADMAVRCEAATSQVFHAALSVRDGTPQAPLDAAAAKAFSGAVAVENARISVQVHGGMGFTEQMTPHLYVKRTQVLDQLFGDRRAHLAAVLTAVA